MDTRLRVHLSLQAERPTRQQIAQDGVNHLAYDLGTATSTVPYWPPLNPAFITAAAAAASKPRALILRSHAWSCHLHKGQTWPIHGLLIPSGHACCQPNLHSSCHLIGQAALQRSQHGPWWACLQLLCPLGLACCHSWGHQGPALLTIIWLPEAVTIYLIQST